VWGGGGGALNLSVALHYSALIGKWEITATRHCYLYLDAKLVTEQTWPVNLMFMGPCIIFIVE